MCYQGDRGIKTGKWLLKQLDGGFGILENLTVQNILKKKKPKNLIHSEDPN